MSPIYDNWGRLVAAVVRQQQLWELFHEHSRSPSMSTVSSDSSFSFQLNSCPNDTLLTFSSPEDSASNHKEDFRADPAEIDDIGGGRAAAAAARKLSSVVIKNIDSLLVPAIVSSSLPRRKRNLIIQVPRFQVQRHGDFSPARDSSERYRNFTPLLQPRDVGRYSESKCNWPDYAKQQSYPLPLPPGASSNSSPPISHPNSPVASTSVPRSPGSCWKKGKVLGKGRHGYVYAGFNRETGEMCAIKEILLTHGAESRQTSKKLEQEIALLSRLKHPNIVRYYGSEMANDKLSIYVEYVSGGSIYHILNQYGKLGDSALRSYTQQILTGLAYLHSKHTVHRNIEGATILVDSNGCVKLSDFGMTKHQNQIAEQSRPKLCTASPYWMAPEVIRNSNVCNQAIDIWSLGCTVLEMATSRPPWSQYDEGVAMLKILNSKELPVIPHYLSDDGKDFVKQCLQWNPLHRPTVARLLKHPFIKSVELLEKKVRSPDQLGSQRLAITPMPSRNMSTPVSTVGIDFHHPRSPQYHSLTTSPSTRSPTTSGSSTPGTSFHHPRSPQYLSPTMSPLTRSPTRSGSSTPLAGGTSIVPYYLSPSNRSPTGSGSSTPLAGGTSIIPYQYFNQSILQQEFFRPEPKLPLSHSSNGPSYWDSDILHRVHSGSHPLRETSSSGNKETALASRASRNLLWIL